MFFDLYALQIPPLVSGLCANPVTTVFTQRRIRRAFEAMTARQSRWRILVVRQSLPSKLHGHPRRLEPGQEDGTGNPRGQGRS
jgi:hypothetical protein